MQQFFILLLTLQHLCWGLKALESTSTTTSEYDANHTISKGDSITIDPQCQKKCGNLTVPYPFGIKSKSLSCSRDSSFDITCNNSTNPPKAFIQTGNIEVYDISDSELRISNDLAYLCYDTFGNETRQPMSVELQGTPYMYSKANVLTVVGCDDFALIYNDPNGYLPKGCTTTCQNISEVTENECSGSGCCQVSINIQHFFWLDLGSFYNHTNVSSFSNCGYAFFGEENSFNFKGISDLEDPNFLNRIAASVPVIFTHSTLDIVCF